jgi:nucleotide-binding universal stress UspA family protein
MAGTATSSPARLKNILVATDYSPVSSRAISFAGALASRFDARLYALHAGELVNYALPVQRWKESAEALRISAEQLGKVLSKSFPGVESAILEGEGPVGKVIQRACGEKNIDLLVLGTRGRRGFAKFLLGSVAEEVLRRAPCPVLTVGPCAQSWDDLGWEGAEILYATDFSPQAHAAAQHAFAWANDFGARLTLLHVLDDGAHLNFGRPQESAEAARRQLEHLLPRDAGGRSAHHLMVERGVPGEKIVETAESIRAALIVTGAREAAGFAGTATHFSGSTLHKVIARAPCAVLSVRE